MLPRGAAPLIAMRKAGEVPSGDVWVSYGDFRDPDWHRWSNTFAHPELVVRFDDPVDRLDLRCLIALRVTLFLSRYDDKAAKLIDRVQGYASAVDVLSPDFECDIGWHWSIKTGQREFNSIERSVS